jgi:hypothetical protein
MREPDVLSGTERSRKGQAMTIPVALLKGFLTWEELAREMCEASKWSAAHAQPGMVNEQEWAEAWSLLTHGYKNAAPGKVEKKN